MGEVFFFFWFFAISDYRIKRSLSMMHLFKRREGHGRQGKVLEQAEGVGRRVGAEHRRQICLREATRQIASLCQQLCRRNGYVVHQNEASSLLSATVHSPLSFLFLLSFFCFVFDKRAN